MSSSKLYCYVDESGQDTLGRFFVVVAVIGGSELRDLESTLLALETASERGIHKWHTSRPQRRSAYVQSLQSTRELKGHIFARIYAEGANYLDRTAYVIGDAVAAYTAANNLEKAPVIVTVDGLKDAEARRVGKVVRQRGLWVDKVRGMRDESTPLIRLADSVAGILREAYEGTGSFAADVSKLKASGIVTDI